MSKVTYMINNQYLWKGAYPCINPNCTAKDKRLWSIGSKSKIYWRYTCQCGTELRIPKTTQEREQ